MNGSLTVLAAALQGWGDTAIRFTQSHTENQLRALIAEPGNSHLETAALRIVLAMKIDAAGMAKRVSEAESEITGSEPFHMATCRHGSPVSECEYCTPRKHPSWGPGPNDSANGEDWD